MNETVARLTAHPRVECVQILTACGNLLAQGHGLGEVNNTMNGIGIGISSSNQNEEVEEEDTTAANGNTTGNNNTNSTNRKKSNSARSAQALLEAATHYLQTTTTSNNSNNNTDDDDDDPVAFLQVRSARGRELWIAPHEGYSLVVRLKPPPPPQDPSNPSAS